MAKKALADREIETLEPRVYEVGYLLSPAVRDEDLEKTVEALKDMVRSRGGEIIAEGAPEFIDLAYPMTKVIENKRYSYDQASFGWIKFELNPAETGSLKEELDGHTLVIRYLFISTVRENTIVSKKPLGKLVKRNNRPAGEDASSEEEEESSLPEVDAPIETTDEEVQKEIEALVKEESVENR